MNPVCVCVCFRVERKEWSRMKSKGKIITHTQEEEEAWLLISDSSTHTPVMIV